MKHKLKTQISIKNKLSKNSLICSIRFLTLLFIAFIVNISNANAELESLPSNTYLPFVNNNFDGLSASYTDVAPTVSCLGGISNGASNVIDNDSSNYALIKFTGLACDATLSIKDGDSEYPAGLFVGFKISTENLLSADVGARVVLTLRKNNEIKQQKVVIQDGLAVNSSIIDEDNNAIIGFVADSSFDEIRITFVSLLGINKTYRVYNAVLKQYEANSLVECNTPTSFSSPDFPVEINLNRTGTDGVLCVGCSVTNVNNVISESDEDYATISHTALVGGVSKISVFDVLTDYDAGHFVGFDIRNQTLLSADLLNGITVKTYLNNQVQEATSDIDLLSIGSLLLTGNDKYRIGFVTTKPFDEVTLEIRNTVAVLNTTEVYNVVIENFCPGEPLECNTITTFNRPNYPVVVNARNSGIDELVCVGCAVTGLDNVISESTTDFATITVGAAVGAKGSIAVKNAIEDYSSNYFVGFDIMNPSLVEADLLSNITIETYLNGVPQESSLDINLVSVNTSILSGLGRQRVGFVTTQPFDEVKISVYNTVGVLNSTFVYNAVIFEACESPNLECGDTIQLANPIHPVVIDGRLTGINDVVCVGCQINEPENLIDDDPNSHSTIVLTAGVLTEASIAVQNVIEDYNAGVFAGFTVRHLTILGVDLIEATTVRTYLNGVLQESRNGDFLHLEILNGTQFLVGFNTIKPFDEVRISLRNLADVDLGVTTILNATIINQSTLINLSPEISGANSSTDTIVVYTDSLVNLDTLVTNIPPVNASIVWYDVSDVNTPLASSTVSFGMYWATFIDSITYCTSSPSNIVLVEPLIDVTTDTIESDCLVDTCFVCLDDVMDIDNIDTSYVCSNGTGAIITTIDASINCDVEVEIVQVNEHTESDTLCVISCDTTLGICDTTIIIVPPYEEDPSPDPPVTDTITADCESVDCEACLDDVIDLEEVDNTTICGAGENTTIEDISSSDSCDILIDITQDGPHDGDTICVVSCDETLGICDTTIIIVPPYEEDPTPDPPVTDTITADCESVDCEACLDDVIDLEEVDNTTICGAGENTTIEDISSSDSCDILIEITQDDPHEGDTICVVSCDETLGICDTTIIIVPPYEEDPSGNPDSSHVQVFEDSFVVICLDTIMDFSDPITNVSICDWGQNGEIEMTSSECITYSPNENYNGWDTICIVVCTDNICDTVTIVVEILPVNDPPIANDDYTTTPFNTTVTVNVVQNDNDSIDVGELDLLSLTILEQANNGVATTNLDGTITYTPNDGFEGIDSFSYMICDLGIPLPALCDTAWVYIEVGEEQSEGCFIPNSFSPNLDGVTDFFEISCVEDFPRLQVMVYNRWGDMVFDSGEGYNNDWAGTWGSSNRQLPDGTYYWIVKFNDGVQKDRAGYVSLIK